MFGWEESLQKLHQSEISFKEECQKEMQKLCSLGKKVNKTNFNNKKIISI